MADKTEINEPKSKTKEFFRVLKYTAFAASAGVIELVSSEVMNRFSYFADKAWLSYLIALVLSVVWNFTFNRKYTFKSANNVPVAMLKVAAFYAVFAPLSTMLEHYLTGTLGWLPVIATVINMAINFVTEFLYQRYFVFGKTIDTNELAKKERQKNK